jgi:hypothetical protein
MLHRVFDEVHNRIAAELVQTAEAEVSCSQMKEIKRQSVTTG